MLYFFAVKFEANLRILKIQCDPYQTILPIKFKFFLVFLSLSWVSILTRSWSLVFASYWSSFSVFSWSAFLFSPWSSILAPSLYATAAPSSSPSWFLSVRFPQRNILKQIKTCFECLWKIKVNFRVYVVKMHSPNPTILRKSFSSFLFVFLLLSLFLLSSSSSGWQQDRISKQILLLWALVKTSSSPTSIMNLQ